MTVEHENVGRHRHLVQCSATSEAQGRGEPELIDLLGTRVSDRVVEHPRDQGFDESFASTRAEQLAVAEFGRKSTRCEVNDDESHAAWSKSAASAYFIESADRGEALRKES